MTDKKADDLIHAINGLTTQIICFKETYAKANKIKGATPYSI